MKHIDRPKEVPDKLLKDGAKETKANIEKYKKTPAKDRGKLKIDIKDTIYGCREVKDTLLKIQKGTCCYCESKFRATSYGAVEHYRPKGGYQQDKSDSTLHQPGYFWLAYDWSNLLYSCTVCNSSYKKNYFPLKNSKVRATSISTQDVSHEEPTILNPYELSDDEIANHLIFINADVYWLSDEGRDTIDYCGLNREELREARLKKFNDLSTIEDEYSLLSGGHMSDIANNMMKKRIASEIEYGEYTLMIKWDFKKYL